MPSTGELLPLQNRKLANSDPTADPLTGTLRRTGDPRPAAAFPSVDLPSLEQEVGKHTPNPTPAKRRNQNYSPYI